MKINYTSEQSTQIDQLKSYVEEYCQKNGIDPTLYTHYLDGDKTTLDSKIYNDPAFQAYWQLAYLQLMEIINPSPLVSGSGEVGEGDFETIYSQTPQEINNFITMLLADNPDLMIFAAQQSGGDVDAISQLLHPPSPEQTEMASGYVNEQARQIAQDLGISGGMWDYLISTDEGLKSTETNLMTMLAEMDAYLKDLDEALSTGELNSEQYGAEVSKLSANRQLVIGYIQQVEDASARMFESFSNLLKANSEAANMIARNLNVSA